MKKAIITIILILLSFWSTEVKADTTITMDGFEEYSTSVLYATSGTVGVTTTNPRTGLYSFYSYGAVGYGNIRPVETNTIVGSTLYTTPANRVCFRVETMPTTRADIFSYYTNAALVKASVWITSTGQLEFYDRNNSLMATSSDGLISTGQYYCLFIKITSASGTSGSLEARLNSDTGTIIASGSGDTLTTGAQTFRLGAVSSTDAYLVYFDDIISDSSNYPKPGKIKIMRLDGAGTYNDVTTYTGDGLYGQINDLPPDTSTYLELYYSSGTRGTTTHSLESTASAGISGTILGIKNQIFGRRAAAGTGYAMATILYGGSDVTSVSAAWSATNIFHYQISEVCPGNVSCTASILDSLEIGGVVYDASSAGSLRITDEYLMVNYDDTETPTATTTGFILYDY